MLPRRVGAHQAEALTTRCLPIGRGRGAADRARRRGPARPTPAFEDVVLADARRLAGRDDYYRLLERKRAARAADERRRPLEAYRAEELAEMSRDIFDDRHGFAAARHAFVMKRPADTQRTDTRTGAQRIVA